jgi:glutamine---fructose-6-phosphate transaminase (isomerizing)
MCGIYGIINKQPTRNLIGKILKGLYGLESRGYDSSGIAVQLPSGNATCFKQIGSVEDLEKKINGLAEEYKVQTGIGHNRWSSHGETNEANAHPHHDFTKKIWLAHNGTLNNETEIKNKLIEKSDDKSINFTLDLYSTTDSELIANLIAYYYGKYTDLKKAVKIACKLLDGQFSIVVFHADIPNLLIGAKNNSPMHLVKTKDEFSLVSDVLAYSTTQNHMKHMHLDSVDSYEIKDNKIAVVTPDGAKITPLFSDSEFDEDIIFETHCLKDFFVTKEGYPYFMEKEIMEQPKTLFATIEDRLIASDPFVRLGGVSLVQDKLKNITRVNIIATGSSGFASKIGGMYFRELCKLDTNEFVSSDYIDNTPILDSQTMVLAISQSGETKDTIDAIQFAKSYDPLILGIVNNAGTRIPSLTDQGIMTNCRKEEGVAATKTFSSQILAQLMLAIYTAKIQNKLPPVQIADLIYEINKLPELVSETLKLKDQIASLAKKYSTKEKFIFFGKGANHHIACEGALKLIEIALSSAQGLASGDAKHGYIALADNDLLSIALIPNDQTFNQTFLCVSEFHGKGSNILAITTPDFDTKLIDKTHDIIVVPKAHRLIQPIINVVVLQLFAYYMSLAHGLDPDRPRNLAKAITIN